MSTQHPDNVATPPYAVEGVLKGEGEIQEAVEVFQLGCDEQLWDSEGKDVDHAVVHKLLGGFPQFFRQHTLGRDCFLTLRVPNPAIEQEMRKTLLESLEGIPGAWDIASEFYGDGVAPPIQEVILPFTTSAEEVNRIYAYYTRYVVGRAEEPLLGDYRVGDWLGPVHPQRIGVIPLIEDLDHLLVADAIVAEYLRDKELPYQRVFLARSDPALNYGVVATELMLKLALQRLSRLEGQVGIPLYPIIGAGSSPFRGNLTPVNLDRCFQEYPSAHTFTIQSAFKYDHPPEVVRQAIARIRQRERGEPVPIDEERAQKMLARYAAEYRRCLRRLSPVVAQMAGLTPQRRERKLHIGLFGYSRALEPDEAGQDTIRLPRAIEFCSSLYALGLPPELLGLAALRAQDLPFLREAYPSLEQDLADALRFASRQAVQRYLGREYVRLLTRFQQGVDLVHEGLTAAVRASLESRPADYTQRYLLEAARLRNFLG
ncbi:MAG: phosphoenolpyruvate carboxylase [Dehalococcoidia bacterium]